MAKLLKSSVFPKFGRHFASGSKISYFPKQTTRDQNTEYEALDDVLENEEISKPKTIRYHVCQERVPVHKMVRSKYSTDEDEKFEKNMKNLQPSALQDYYCRSG